MPDQKNLPSVAVGCIAQMVEQRDAALALMYQALDLIVEAKAIAPQHAFDSALGNDVSWYGMDAKRNKKIVRVALDKRCWRSLLDHTKFGAVLNSEQLGVIRRDIEELAPELTLNRAMTTFFDLYNDREAAFRAGLIEVFRRLCGMYKSHDHFKVQNRIIFAAALSPYGGWQSCGQRDRFNDLWHYLSLLDGINPADVPHDEQPDSIIAAGTRLGLDGYDFPYFRVVSFKNGNIHVWLNKRPDLIGKVNALIAEHYGKALPD